MGVLDPEVLQGQRDIHARTLGRYPTDLHEDHRVRCLQLAAEAFEVLDLAQWKPHRHDRSKSIDKDRLLDEMVDVYKFWLNLLIVHGVRIDEFERAYERKHAIVLERLRKEGL